MALQTTFNTTVKFTGGTGIAGLGDSGFVPRNIAGCKLWLRADLGATVSGGNLTALADQSGNGNDVTNVGTVTYVASAIGGQPGFTSTGAIGMTNTTTNPLTAGGARTIFVVFASLTAAGGIAMELRRTTNGCAYILAGTGSSYGAGVCYYDTVVSNNGLVTSPGDMTGVATIAEWGAAAAGKVTLTTNGTALTVTQTSACNTETGTAGFGIGLGFGATFSALGSVGNICEAIIYDTVLSARDRVVVRKYLGSRYGISA